MAVKKTNNRFLIKRSTVTGKTPTIPGSGATNIYDHTLGGWINTDLYEGELFMNVADDKIWMRTTGGTYLLGYSGMTTDYIDLDDTPAAYATYGGYGSRVNVGETGMEFYQLTANTFLGLPDTPSSFETGRTLVSNSAMTDLEWQDTYSTWVTLTDTPSSIDANYLVVGNSGGTALEMILSTTNLIDKTTVQTITAAKTFSGLQTLNSGLTLTGNFTYGGQLITEISTDTGFTAATNNQLTTAYATKMYVDDQVFGTGVTAFVTLGGSQTITGAKTFNALVTYNSGFTITGDINVGADIYVTGNTYNNLTSYNYWGDVTTDGSYRQYIDTNGNFTIESRSGSWSDNVFAITNSGVSIGTYTGSTGIYNFSIGNNNQADGTYSFAGGSNSQASGNRSFAFGQSAEANDYATFAIGNNCTADGSASFAGGTYSVASGRTCFAFYSTVNNSHSGLTGGADRSVILGGYDHTCTHAHSVILGGTGITSDADDTVFMRKLDVSDAITSNGSVGYTGIVSIGGTSAQFVNGIFIGLP